MTIPYLNTARPVPMSDIPEEYRDIAEAIGLEAFTQLTLLCGGQSLFTSPNENPWSVTPVTGTSGHGSTAATTGRWRFSSVSASGRSARSSTAPALKIGQNSREFCPRIALSFAPHGAGERPSPFLFFTFL